VSLDSVLRIEGGVLGIFGVDMDEDEIYSILHILQLVFPFESNVRKTR